MANWAINLIISIISILFGGGFFYKLFKYIKYKKEKDKKDREQIIKENQKNRQFKWKIEQEKTKRLILQLENAKDIERENIKKENSNNPTLILEVYRKGRKGKQ